MQLDHKIVSLLRMSMLLLVLFADVDTVSVAMRLFSVN